MTAQDRPAASPLPVISQVNAVQKEPRALELSDHHHGWVLILCGKAWLGHGLPSSDH